MFMHSCNEPEGFKQMLSALQKADGKFFWDSRGVLVVGFMQQETTIMSQMHCETLKELSRVIQNKGCGMMTLSSMRMCVQT
jgi:hypothetical protein